MAKAKGERLNGLGIVIIILVIQYLRQEWIFIPSYVAKNW